MKLYKEKIEELIRRHYEGNSNYVIKNLEVGIEKWRNKKDTGYRPRVDMDGWGEDINGDLIQTEITLNEEKMTKIIKEELKKEGYEVEEVKFEFTEKGFEYAEAILKENNKRVIDVKNLKMYKACLIVVDMVNGFVREGVLHDEKIANVIPRQIELIRQAKNEGKLIVFIKDTHDKDAVEFERFENTKHCVEGDREAELVDELKPFEYLNDTISIPKNSTCFVEAKVFRELMEWEKEMNEFDIVGCCTDICVANGAIALANLLDEENRKHKIRVHKDAVATYDEDNRKEYVDAANLLMKQQGIELVKKGR